MKVTLELQPAQPARLRSMHALLALSLLCTSLLQLAIITHAAPAALEVSSRCTVSLTSSVLDVFCAGSVPISLAKLSNPAAFKTVSINGAAEADDAGCESTKDALVTICSRASQLALVNSTIRGLTVATGPLPTNATLLDNLAVLGGLSVLSIRSSGSVLVSELTAAQVSGATALAVTTTSPRASVIIANSTFSDISAPASTGGGLYIKLQGPTGSGAGNTSAAGATVVMQGNSFTKCQAHRGGGAAVDLVSPGNGQGIPLAFGLQGVNVFRGCKALQKSGGGLLVNVTGTQGSAVFVGGSAEFVGNSAETSGGGLFVAMDNAVNTQLVMEGELLWEQNTARQAGGAVAVGIRRSFGCSVGCAGRQTFANNSMLRHEDWQLRGEGVGGNGGGMSVLALLSVGASVDVGGEVRFIGNRALTEGDPNNLNGTSLLGEGGGGLGLQLLNATGARVVVAGDASFVGNTAEVGGGMSVQMSGSNLTSISFGGRAVFRNNFASGEGGGVVVAMITSTQCNVTVAGRVVFKNNVVLGNSSGGGMNVYMVEAFRPIVQVGGEVVFTENRVLGAGALGGALALVGLGVVLPQLTVAGNASFESNAGGFSGSLSFFLPRSIGAIALVEGSAQFVNNTANGGGAVSFYLQGSNQSVALVQGDTVFRDNRVSTWGGACMIDVTLSEGALAGVRGAALFLNNTAGIDGGAVQVNMTASVGARVLIGGGSLFRGNGANRGGGAVSALMPRAVRSAMFVAGNATFVGNQVWNGSASNAKSYSSGGAVDINILQSLHCNATVEEGATFVGNRAAFGGAVYFGAENATEAVVAVRGFASFVANNASTSGGGVYIDLSNATLVAAVVGGDAVFVNNTVMAGYGGGVHFDVIGVVDSVALVGGRARFWNNTAMNETSLGGGVSMIMNMAVNSSVVVDGEPDFIDNYCGGQGAGVSVTQVNSTRCTVRLEGMPRFKGNQAVAWGGGYSVASVNSTRCSMEASGGAVFEGNTAGAGGGMVVQFNQAQFGNITLTNVTTVNNTAQYAGGGVLLYLNQASNTTAALRGIMFGSNVVTGVNTSGSGGGGGLAVDFSTSNDTRLQVEGSRWVGNRAAQRAGGLLVYANASTTSTLAISGAEFVLNTADGGAGGGALLVFGPETQDPNNNITGVLTDSVFLGNVVRDGVGGGLYLEGSSKAVTDCFLMNSTACPWVSLRGRNLTFQSNSATYGGGVYAIESQFELEQASFVNNSATWFGGAAYLKRLLGFAVDRGEFLSNSAGRQGGAIFGSIGDDFSNNYVAANNSVFSNNSAGSQGGGLYLQGGLTYLLGTNITDNRARQQGGGIAFVNICGNSSACALQLEPSTLGPNFTAAPTLIRNNSAQTGGGVFLAIPGNTGVDLAAISRAAPADVNTAVYSAGVSVAPFLLTVPKTEFSVPSSTGSNGLIPLVAYVGQPAIRVTADFCDLNNDTAYLTGGTEKSAADERGTAEFRTLRLLGGMVDEVYCLQVSAPDYPDVLPAEVFVRIRDCIQGEYRDNVGCAQCPVGQFSFGTNTNCSSCDANAQCTGGTVFIPNPGYWHSSPTSSHVQICPNRNACRAPRAPLATCQANFSCPTDAFDYRTLQCSQGYAGNLCGSCRTDLGYGLGLYLRCSKCMSKAASIVVLLILAAASCLLVVFISSKSLAEAAQTSAAVAATQQPSALPIERASGPPLPHGAAHEGATSRAQLELSDVFKVLVVHLQYLSIIGNLLIDWPSALRTMINVARLLFVTSSSEIVSWNCLGGLGNGAIMVLSVLTPLSVIAAACTVMALFARLRLRSGLQAVGMVNGAPASAGAVHKSVVGSPSGSGSSSLVVDYVVATVLVGVFLFYSILTSASLSAFSCIGVDDDPYWIKDMRVRCWSARHLRSSLVVGIIGVLAFCLAVPALTIWWLSRNRSRLDDPDFRRRYGFLYRLYRRRYPFWEGVVCLQTVALVSIDLFVRRHGPFYQLVLLILVLIANSTLVQVLRPFRCRSLQWLYVASTSSLLLTCLGVLSLLRGYSLDREASSDGVRSGVVVVVMVVNVVFVAVSVYLMAEAAAKMARAPLQFVSRRLSMATSWATSMKKGGKGSCWAMRQKGGALQQGAKDADDDDDDGDEEDSVVVQAVGGQPAGRR